MFLALLALGTFPAPAWSQTVWAERATFLEQYRMLYAERPVALGLLSNGSVLEVLASKDGSRTIIVTRPDGVGTVSV